MEPNVGLERIDTTSKRHLYITTIYMEFDQRNIEQYGIWMRIHLDQQLKWTLRKRRREIERNHDTTGIKWMHAV